MVLLIFITDLINQKMLDTQELRLQFEKGDITLYEWVPIKIKINALLSKKTTNGFREQP